MNRALRVTRAFLLCALSLVFGTAKSSEPNARPNELAKEASWQWPNAASYQALLTSYLEQNASSPEVAEQVDRAWSAKSDSARGPELLELLLDASSIVDSRIAELVTQLRSPASQMIPLGELPWLTSDTPGWLQDTLRLAYGRAFAQRRLYDEALEMLAGLELSEVCDPASLLFYRALCEHHLLKKDECLVNLKRLLERESELPSRFSQVAALMKADIAPLETDSLDEVSRLMNVVQRRLDLGRAGQRVRDEEKQIVDKLDKLIDQIEQQLQQAQQQSQQDESQSKPGQVQPMDDSRIAGGSGPGDVDQKQIGDRAGWGNLPPAERQEALQRLTEELPSHYRDIIEGYFRQLAKDR